MSQEPADKRSIFNNQKKMKESKAIDLKVCSETTLRNSTETIMETSLKNCRHFDVLDYDRIKVRLIVNDLQVWNMIFIECLQHGFPPILRKTKPLEECHKAITKAPVIFKRRPYNEPHKRKEAPKRDSSEPVDIKWLVETKVKKLDDKAFLYLMPTEPFMPYSFM